MEHLMIDIETLGNKSFSIITSISAVFFDIKTGNIGNQFNVNIDIQSSLNYGLKPTGSTIKWWLQQSREASSKMFEDTVALPKAIELFYDFCKLYDFHPWGNSARFDLGLLDNAFSICGYELPWKFWKELDVRTMVFLNPNPKNQTPFDGIAHYGIDDCKHQIKYVCEIYKSLNAISYGE